MADEQKLGRVHRPGQLKACHLYRFFSTGSLEETILDRQAGKSSLLESLTKDVLPDTQSDDRALLFDLDEPAVVSRLMAQAEADSPYRNAEVWVPHDLSEQSTVDRLEPAWLRELASIPLEAAEWHARGGGADVRPAGGVDAVDADDDEDADEDEDALPQAAIDGMCDTRILSHMLSRVDTTVRDAELPVPVPTGGPVVGR